MTWSPDLALVFQIERCIVLIRANPGAARRFYQLAVSHLTPANVAKFILTIHSAILQCVREEEEGKREEEEEESEGKREEEGEEKAQEDEGTMDDDAASTSSDHPAPERDPTGIATGGWKEEGAAERSELQESMEAETGVCVCVCGKMHPFPNDVIMM